MVFVSPTLGRGVNFGGARVSLATLEMLKIARPDAVVSVSLGSSLGAGDVLVPATASRLETALHNLAGYSGTLKAASISRILRLVGESEPDCVWLDSSLLGRLAKALKRRFPRLRLVSFFHNIEFDMQKMRVRHDNILYAIACVSDWVNERLTLKYADACVMLTSTDSKRAEFLYGRGADFIVPISLPDTAPAGIPCVDAAAIGPDRYLLFVGAVFGPNLDAARFIARELAPLLPSGLRAIIVGNGFDAYAEELSRPNVTVLGAVEDLASLYAGASFVLAPVFTGGGMKVKIAEALMHGKRVLASPFAAIGYEKSVSAGSTVVCDRPSDYARMCSRLPQAARSSARSDYESYYSIEANADLVKVVAGGPHRRETAEAVA